MIRKSFAVAILAASVLALAPAAARPPVVVTANTDVPMRHVSFADLDLANPLGQRTLESRVRGAAFEVCAESGWTNGSREQALGFMTCRHDSMERARPAMAAAAQRAREIAATGHSTIAFAAAISLSGQ